MLRLYDEAEEQYLKALQINPHNILVKYNLGILYQLTNEWTNAILLYQRVVNSYTERVLEEIARQNTSVTVNSTADEDVEIDPETGTGTAAPPAPALGTISSHTLSEADIEIYLNAKIRECDLLQTLFFQRNLTSELLHYYQHKGYGSPAPPGSGGESSVASLHQVVANCWIQGLQLFPQSHVMYNELGNLLLRVCVFCV